MSFNAGTIKLGRLFMVAWLAFFFYPIEVILTQPFAGQDKAIALGLLLSSGLIWAWFWTRVLGGPDERFRWLAYGLTAATIGVFTLMTPAKYGTLFVCVTIIAGAAFPWRLAVPLVVASALVGGIFDIIRGTEPLQATGEVLNDGIVGLAAVAGRLLVQANQQLSLAREQIARLAVGEERLRFARDLHDLLGHSLSVIALKSELARRLLPGDPARASAEVRDIEQVTRDALVEVREAVGGYRRMSLASELRGAEAALHAAGIEPEISQPAVSFAPDVESVLAWAVREGTTNVIRHSRARHCTIHVHGSLSDAGIEIVDDGTSGPEADGGAGSGLAGLTERVRRRHGRLEAGHDPGGGFRLVVELPALP